MIIAKSNSIPGQRQLNWKFRISPLPWPHSNSDYRPHASVWISYNGSCGSIIPPFPRGLLKGVRQDKTFRLR
jgi:hypothetical protein